MKQQINKHIRDYKFGFQSKEETQRKICMECLQHPSQECIRPCQIKRITQTQRHTGKKRELPQQRQYKGMKLVIEPNNIEIIQKAQLDLIPMVTIEPRKFFRDWQNRQIKLYFHHEEKLKSIRIVKGDGHIWTQWLWYKIGSEQSKRTVN